MHRFIALLATLALFVAAPSPSQADDGYERDTVLAEAEAFFGDGAAGIGDAVARVFDSHGKPSGYIKGEEAGGALGFGLRYGHGTLHLKNGAVRKVYWQSPTIGFDAGGNAAKAFVLVYNVHDPDVIYQRYPGVDGSAYLVGGVGLNYNQSGNVVLAPMRFGVGLRLGASVGYLKVTRKKTLLPF